MNRCAGPKCHRPAYALDLCRGHYAQWKRREANGEDGSTLCPLRDPAAAPRVVLTMRVSPETKAAAAADPEGARAAVERWAKRRH
jgi:hypothetical protein